MMEDYLNIIIPYGGIISFIAIVSFIIYKNKGLSGRTTKYYSTKDIFSRCKCPVCECKMKKKWIKEEYNPLQLDMRHKTYCMSAYFVCPNCEYEVKNDGN